MHYFQQRRKEEEGLKKRKDENKLRKIETLRKNKFSYIESDYAKGRENSNSDSNMSPKHDFMKRKSVS